MLALGISNPQLVVTGFDGVECAYGKALEGWFGHSSEATKKGRWKEYERVEARTSQSF